MKRLFFPTGLATGFVVGARGGRQAYVAMKARAQTLAQRPEVQSVVEKAKDLATSKAPTLTGTVQGVTDVAKSAAAAAQEAGESTSDTVAPTAA